MSRVLPYPGPSGFQWNPYFNGRFAGGQTTLPYINYLQEEVNRMSLGMESMPPWPAPYGYGGMYPDMGFQHQLIDPTMAQASQNFHAVMNGMAAPPARGLQATGHDPAIDPAHGTGHGAGGAAERDNSFGGWAKDIGGWAVAGAALGGAAVGVFSLGIGAPAGAAIGAGIGAIVGAVKHALLG